MQSAEKQLRDIYKVDRQRKREQLRNRKGVDTETLLEAWSWAILTAISNNSSFARHIDMEKTKRREEQESVITWGRRWSRASLVSVPMASPTSNCRTLPWWWDWTSGMVMMLIRPKTLIVMTAPDPYSQSWNTVVLIGSSWPCRWWSWACCSIWTCNKMSNHNVQCLDGWTQINSIQLSVQQNS